MNEIEPCRMCGGDGRISNSFGGSSATCPSCHGSGRRVETTGFHDVTRTKPSHYRQPNKAEVAAKAVWPSTGDGAALATEIQASAIVSADTKAKLIREIIDHEASHGQCTQTFLKKIRKQIRVRVGLSHEVTRSTFAGTYLCHGVPTNGSRSSVAVNSFGAIPAALSPASDG